MESTEAQELNTTVTENSNTESKPEEVRQETKIEEKPKTFKENLREKVTEIQRREAKTQEKTEKKESKPKISFDDIGSVAPADMSKEEKEMFLKLDPQAQTYLARVSKQYRSDYGRQTQNIKNIEAKYRPIVEVLSPMEQELVKLGIRPEDAVREALQWKKAGLADKKGAAKEYLKSFGIDPIDLIDDDVPADDPNTGVVNANELRQQIRDEILQEINKEKMIEAQKYALQNSQEVVNKFIKAKPLFSDPVIGERLELAMAGDVQRTLASNPNQEIETVLEDSYKYITEKFPEFRDILQKYNAKAEAERIQSEADKARMASRTITGGVSTPVPNVNRGVPFKEALRRNLGGSYS